MSQQPFSKNIAAPAFDIFLLCGSVRPVPFYKAVCSQQKHSRLAHLNAFRRTRRQNRLQRRHTKTAPQYGGLGRPLRLQRGSADHALTKPLAPSSRKAALWTHAAPWRALCKRFSFTESLPCKSARLPVAMLPHAIVTRLQKPPPERRTTHPAHGLCQGHDGFAKGRCLSGQAFCFQTGRLFPCR